MPESPPPPAARTVEGPGGLPAVEVTTSFGRALVLRQGAHVLEWEPVDAGPVLWCSSRARFEPGVAVRGGIPVCFPWFGAREGGPSHGFARVSDWDLLGADASPDGALTVRLRLADDERTRSAWPWRFTAELAVTVGRSLDVALTAGSTEARPLEITAALHSYLRVADVTRVGLTGLGGTAFVDKAAAGALRHSGPEPHRVVGETDRVHRATSPVVVHDDDRRLEVASRGSTATVVWNPGAARAGDLPDVGPDEWRQFVCVEAAAVEPHPLVLEPGGSVTLATRLTVLTP